MPIFDVQKPANVEREKINFIAAEYHNQRHEAYYCQEQKKWYLYNGCIYRECHRLEMMNRIAEIFPNIEKLPIKKHREILENLERLACVRAEELNAEPGIAFRNFFLNTETLEIHEHSRNRLVTIALNYDYNPAANCSLWKSSIAEICENDDDKINTIQEFFGYCLSRNVQYKKALLLVGESDTGKSVILETLINMLGEANTTAVSLKDFSEPQYLATMHGKLANISTETDPNVEQYETQFKIITTGERLKVKEVYEKPYEFRPFCKLVMAANQAPRIHDKSNAVYNRLLLISFNKIFSPDEQNTNLIDELKTELPGILNWSIEGLKRLRDRGRFHLTQHMINLLDELKLENNPILLWTKEYITVCPEGELEKGAVYEHFTRWAKENGYRQIGLARFSAQFYEIFHSHTMKNTQRPHGTDRKRIWPGLAWRTETETKEEQKVWEE